MSRSSRMGIVLVAALAAACVATEGDPGGEQVDRSQASARGILEATWSADGARLAATRLEGDEIRLLGLYGPVDRAAPSEGLPLAEGSAGWGSWAPDGLWVAYTTDRDGNREIYRARPDGMAPENLTRDPADDSDPAYSPDGRTLAFVSTRDGGTPKLHVMDADGGAPRLLVELDGPVRRPTWSPDGLRLAVHVTEEGRDAIYLVAADGRGVGRLSFGSFPAWFPDGDRVTYTENDSIFWRPANGGSRRLLLPDARMGRPSPDGDWLAFVRGESHQAGLYLLNVADGTETRITPP